MKLKISIKFIILFIVIASTMIIITIYQSKYTQIRISREKSLSNYMSTEKELNSFLNDIEISEILLKSWLINSEDQSIEKQKLNEIYLNISNYKKTLNKYSAEWSDNNNLIYNRLSNRLSDTLLKYHKTITGKLCKKENYSIYKKDILYYNKLLAKNGEISKLTKSSIADISLLKANIEMKISNINAEIEKHIKYNEDLILASAIVYIILILLLFLYASFLTIRPIKKINFILNLLNKGEIPEYELKEKADEIGELTHALNILINNQKKIIYFSNEIGKKNFKVEYKQLGKNDILGNTLNDMRENLMSAENEALARKKEDNQRNWITQGIAKFGDILRQNNDDLEVLTNSIISNLIKYIDANQGGVFITNNDDTDNVFIELVASYAYAKTKHLDKKIEMGIGLIGRSIQEKETIFLTDIPNEYINIKSGLGNDNPRCLLIVPLKVNEKVYGAIEIASFKVFEKYQIEFIEKICENIASSLASVKVNIQTNNLLKKTQQQAAEMREQEEEMRQNMEELQATQEESSRREAELEKKVKEFDKYKKNQENLLNKLGKGKLSGGLFK